MNRYRLTKAGIKPNEGIERFGGNVELYERLLGTFREDDHYKKMMEAIMQNDVEEAFQNAHALKGMAGNMSMNDLYESINPLVEELRRKSMERVAELVIPVSQNYQRIMEALS